MDAIVLIAQMHTSGRDAVQRLRREGLGDLASLSRQKPEKIAKILGIRRAKAQAMIRDARRELGLSTKRSRPPRTRSKSASRGRGTRARRGTRGGNHKEPQGLSCEETRVLLEGERSLQEKDKPEPIAPQRPEKPFPVEKAPEHKPEGTSRSFWNFG